MSNEPVTSPLPTSPLFAKWLAHANHLERQSALATLLANSQHVARYEASIPACLGDADETTRELAVHIMGHIRPLPAKDIGRAARKHQPTSVRLAAAQVLAAAGPDGADGAKGVATCLMSPNATLRQTASIALGMIGHASVEPCCAILRAGPPPPSIIATLDALAIIGPDARGALDDIRVHVDARIAEVRSAASAALVKIAGDSDGVEALTMLMQDDDETVRRNAVERTGMLGHDGREAIPTVRHAVDDESAPVRSAALVALTRLNDESVHLARLATRRLADHDPVVRRMACAALGTTREAGRPACPRLQTLLNDTDEMVAAAARQALRDILVAASRRDRLADRFS